MAIEKTIFKLSRLDSEFSPRSRESMSSEDEEFQRRSSAIESGDDDYEFDDCDSGAGSDDFDLLELGQTGEEFCQVGGQTCSIPFELYDLPDLNDVLSMDVWNDILTEEERFNLAKFLPDLDQVTFMRTLKELFTGDDLHFGSPVNKLFDMLKGGLCEPRVALYRQGLNFFQKRQHYHHLWKHQNSMISNVYQIKDAWLNCRGYSIQEKLRVLNIMKSQKSLLYENMEQLESDSCESEESGDGLWIKRLKNRKLGQKLHRYSGSGGGTSPALEFPAQERQITLGPAKNGKQNPKGTLKLAGSKKSTAKELAGCFPSFHRGTEIKSGLYGSVLSLSRENKAASYDSGVAVRMRNQMRVYDDGEEPMYEVSVERDRHFSRVSAVDKVGALRKGKKHEDLGDEEYTDRFMGLPMSLKNDLHAYGRKRTVNQLSDIKVLTTNPSNMRIVDDSGKRVKYAVAVQQVAGEDQMKSAKKKAPNLSLKGSKIEFSDQAEPFWRKKAQVEPFSVDPLSQYGDWNGRSKKWKIGRESPDLQVNDSVFQSKYRAKPLQDSVRAISMRNRGRDKLRTKCFRTFVKSEETESDSSEQIDEDVDDNPLMRSKLAYPGDASAIKAAPDSKKAKFAKKYKKDSPWAPDGLLHSSRSIGDFGESSHLAAVENYSLKAKQKGKMCDVGHLSNSTAEGLEDNYFLGSGRLNGDDNQKKIYNIGRNGELQGEDSGRFYISSQKKYLAERTQNREVEHDCSAPQSNHHHDYIVDEHVDTLRARQLARVSGRFGKKGRFLEAFVDDSHERSDAQVLGSKSVTKKRKLKDDVTYMDEQGDNDLLHSTPHQHPEVDDITSSKKRGKRKLEDDIGIPENRALEPPVTEMAVEDAELNTKPKKKPFTLITPTVHTGFSFSIIHLLSAVRMAMITLLPEDSSEVANLDNNDGRQKLGEEDRKQEVSNGNCPHENLDICNSEHSRLVNLPSLTIQEIVNRVRSNPGDPCILETQEPLQDLVRGVLKILSSRTAPLGAKGWKVLAYYEKSTKSWSWIGPVTSNSSDHEAVEEVTSPEAWGLPHKVLLKLVDAFANWFRSSQETLQQIGSLPAPPLTLMQCNLDEKERFRDLRAQKSLTTISPSSEELRAYFRKEEVLRYSIPDRAFSYTAIDGRKAIVAPLRRCGGKPTSKARDHFMLKRDRPPHVTVLCIVRDAAARLPGSIGTRADVCILIRDSQFIVEDVSDTQVNQVVSGALDRLHYERDPCVQFDGDRKLWVYLHRDREEEDFDDDGTSSTKKWKRPKKEAGEPFDQGTVTVAYHGSGKQSGVDLGSEVNAEQSFVDDDKIEELVSDDDRHLAEDNVEASHGAQQCVTHLGPATVWAAPGLNPMQETELLCQENSTNEDFDDETFGREPPLNF
ncbi:unnamed protein product [Ilex paraguariensis]|uniref:DEUBAD domain-containing protein n=1 Tax=Ilex paraguariensis TaxID=185542 RepID=A0ABC8TRF2_9AQUA